MGMLDIWVHEGLGFSNEYVKKSVKLRLDDMFKQQWQEDVNNHDYCDHYKIIKNQWGIESYLTKLSFVNRLSFCKWRCRSNQIPITKSRFDINDEIICPLCHNDSIGDEIHYLIDCKFFDSDRKKLQDEISTQITRQNINGIFMSENTFILNKLLNFLKLIMHIFNNRRSWDRDLNDSFSSLEDSF